MAYLVFIVCAGLAVGFAEQRVPFVARLGGVTLAYGVGLALSIVLPAGLPLQSLAAGAVAVALSLLLLGVDVPALLGPSRRVAQAYGLFVGAMGVAGAAVAIIGARVAPGTAGFAGMATATYTGGSPNLAAVGATLGLGPEVILAASTGDLAAGGLYWMALLTIAPPLARRFLPTAVPQQLHGVAAAPGTPNTRPALHRVLLGILSAVLPLAAAGACSLVTDGAMQVPLVLLGLTVAALGLSFVPAIRVLPGRNALGEATLLVFCVAIGAATDLEVFLAQGGVVFVTMAAVLALGLLGGYGLCKLWNVPADIAMLASAAAVFSPGVLPVLTRRLGRPELLVGAVACGLLGYGIGHPLGTTIALLAR